MMRCLIDNTPPLTPGMPSVLIFLSSFPTNFSRALSNRLTYVKYTAVTTQSIIMITSMEEEEHPLSVRGSEAFSLVACVVALLPC